MSTLSPLADRRGGGGRGRRCGRRDLRRSSERRAGAPHCGGGGKHRAGPVSVPISRRWVARVAALTAAVAVGLVLARGAARGAIVLVLGLVALAVAVPMVLAPIAQSQRSGRPLRRGM